MVNDGTQIATKCFSNQFSKRMSSVSSNSAPAMPNGLFPPIRRIRTRLPVWRVSLIATLYYTDIFPPVQIRNRSLYRDFP